MNIVKGKLRIASVFLAAVLIFTTIFAGCDNINKSLVNDNPLNGVDYPMIVFGEETFTNGITYTFDSKEKLKTGEILGKEYIKFEKNMTLSLKIDKTFAKKLSGKNLFLKFEYYETNSKSFIVGYKSNDGSKKEKLSMSGSTNWGGIAVKASAVELDTKADSHITLELDNANAMWLRSISIVEDTTQKQTYPQILKTDYESSNGKVIEANIKDFGAVGDGKTDDSIAFQTALRSMEGKGGVLYIPAGMYKLSQDIKVPKGVTVLGDFNRPSLDNPKVEGTVLAAYVPSIADGSTSLFMSMDMGSCAKGLTIWYPEQTLDSGVAEPYNYTIGITGAIGVSIEDIYLVNSYNGITHASYDKGHYQQMVKNIYGTPLRTGHLTGRATDSDRQQGFYFSPKYWLGSGLENIPDSKILNNWLINYGVGLNVGDIDFHFISDINIDGYKIGMYMRKFYGRLYNLNITNCNVCVYVENTVLYGGQITKAVLKADGGENPVALLVGEGAENGFSGTMLDLSSTGKYALSHLGNGAMSITDSRISVTDKNSVNPLYVADGRVSIMNTEFEGGINHISFGSNAEESSVLNCKATSGELKVENNTENMLTLETVEENVAPLASDVLDTVDVKREYQNKKPAKTVLYNITDYGVLDGEQPDISEALQKAIDEASKNGGGLVYIPAGVYRLETPIVVKTGVEIVGVSDYFHYINDQIPTSAILTDYGKNGAIEPLIKLEENSGVRGLSIVYDKVTQETIQKYTPTVQATGKDCYTINTSIVGTWDALDYNTYKCDNHYIENVNFFAFNKGIAIGGGSTGGVLLNGHTNPGEMCDTGFNTYKWDNTRTGPLNTHQQENTISFYFGECTDQVSFMTITFGAKRGVMIDGADIVMIGHGTDFAVNDIYITGDSNVNIFDPQCIGAENTSEPYESTAIVCDKNFTGTANVYNMCLWSIKDAAIRVDNGTFTMNGGYFLHTGRSPLIATGGKITMRGVIVKNRAIADIQASGDVKSITAYGNIIYGTPTFSIESPIKTYGSDLH